VRIINLLLGVDGCGERIELHPGLDSLSGEATVGQGRLPLHGSSGVIASQVLYGRHGLGQLLLVAMAALLDQVVVVQTVQILVVFDGVAHGQVDAAQLLSLVDEQCATEACVEQSQHFTRSDREFRSGVVAEARDTASLVMVLHESGCPAIRGGRDETLSAGDGRLHVGELVVVGFASELVDFVNADIADVELEDLWHS